MTTIFDVLIWVWEWCRDTYYAPITIGDTTFTFTILQIITFPLFAGLTILVIKGIKSLLD